MIEVEKRYWSYSAIKNTLHNVCDFVGCEILENDYYDFDNFFLIKNKMHLRKRNSNWQLKIPINYTDTVHEEIYDIKRIELFCGDLNLLHKVVTLRTKRVNYLFNNISLSVDSVFIEENFAYEMIEMEIVVKKKNEIRDALRSIAECEKNIFSNLQLIKAPTKLEYYWQCKNN